MEWTPRDRFDSWISEEPSPPGAVPSSWTIGVDTATGRPLLRYWMSEGEGPRTVDWTCDDPLIDEQAARQVFAIVYLRRLAHDSWAERVPTFAVRRLGSDAARVVMPHPPRVADLLALLDRTEHLTRVRWLADAVERVVRHWQLWARTAELTYFSGISMESVPPDTLPACVCAARTWLDGDASHLSTAAAPVPMALSARAMGEWELDDPRAEYAFMAGYNLVRLCVEIPTGEQAGLVIRQVLSAATVDSADRYRGHDEAQELIDRWWWDLL